MVLPLTFINKLLPFCLCWYVPVFTHIFGHNIILRISCYILGRVLVAIRDLWPVVECSPGIASSRFLDVLIKRNGIVMKFFYCRIVGILHFCYVSIVGMIFLLKLFHIQIFQVFIITHDSRILLVILLGSRTFNRGDFFLFLFI